MSTPTHSRKPTPPVMGSTVKSAVVVLQTAMSSTKMLFRIM